MNIHLVQSHIENDGAFGQFTTEAGEHICFTLEHAYPLWNGVYTTKIKNGAYTCVLGWSTEFKMLVYRIMGVPSCTGIEIHRGNFDGDSKGCVLLGSNVIPQASGDLMLEKSADAFNAFMQMQNGVKTFELTVSGKDS